MSVPMNHVTATWALGGYSEPFLVDSQCILQCTNGPCERQELCQADVELMRMIQSVTGEVESQLQARGWNGSLKHSPGRFTPVSYQKQVVNGINYKIHAVLDDMDVDLILHKAPPHQGSKLTVTHIQHRKR